MYTSSSSSKEAAQREAPANLQVGIHMTGPLPASSAVICTGGCEAFGPLLSMLVVIIPCTMFDNIIGCLPHVVSLCRYFLFGKCSKGHQCPFPHVGMPVTRYISCRFFQHGHCAKVSGASCQCSCQGCVPSKRHAATTPSIYFACIDQFCACCLRVSRFTLPKEA